MKSNSKNIINKIKSKFQSIRVKLFLSLSITVIVIIVFLILINSIGLEAYYIHSKEAVLLKTYNVINGYYNGEIREGNIETELEKLSLSNDFDILIKTDKRIYASSKDFLSSLNLFDDTVDLEKTIEQDILYDDKNVEIKKTTDRETELSFILLSANLDNGYELYIRVAVAPIQASAKTSNRLLIIMGCFTIVIGGIIVLAISKKFTSPIEELNNITKEISELNFEHKYEVNNSEDEINNLGKNINAMSKTLEATIKELKKSNIELEKDIEEKSKTDEMRKQFISDVSHELKTPIALIQGYAEGLVENVAEDEESRKFYAEVILDESNKMDILVKKLLELMKLEYGKNTLTPTRFNISELIKEVIRKSKKLLDENNINIEFSAEEIFVLSDEFYTEQVFNNYFTNAIKNALEVNGKKEIKITYKKEETKLRISVFNTGENIEEENLNRIWNRFYKVDSSRNRENGGTGIGLALVKAIMINMGNKYGVENKEDGVEFYFELDLDMQN